ncbi:MAG: HTH domain-containing protein [Haloferacaceae archaeon]
MGTLRVPADGRECTVQAFVRAERVGDIDEVLARLGRLAEAGVIDGLSVRTWPSAAPLSPDVRAPTVDRYDRFAAWADREGKSLEPGFQVRTRSSDITGASRRVLTTPTACLAVYEGELLRSVFPHADDDGHHSVADAVDALEAGRFRPAGAPRVDVCPDCGTGLVNVQGLLACADCAWSPDGVDALAARSATVRRDRSVDARDACPDCGTGLADVQGLLACPACDWVSVASAERTRGAAREEGGA